ncbi:hypothetical protein R6Q57_018029 [Mikania cordata]
MDELIHHPWLKFPQGTIARNMRDRLPRKEMGQQKAIDYNLLAELGQLERMTAIIGEDTPWSRLFEMTFTPQYKLITVEFLSTFVFRPRVVDQPQADPDQPEVSFRLCGLAYAMSLAEFGNALGLYTEEELQMSIYTSAIHTADDAVFSAWWPRIGDEPFVRAARAFAPVRLDKRTVKGMRVVQKFPEVGLRFSLQKGVIWLSWPNDLHYRDEDPMPQPQQQHEQPPAQDLPHQHPERV